MDWTTNVAVHESALPEFTRASMATQLKQGELHPSLLYGGLRQTLKWIELHRAFSPARHDPSCAEIYSAAFSGAAARLKGNVAHVVSLACGDGSKDSACLELLRGQGRAVLYTPADISLEMVLTAERAAAALRGLQSTPLLFDLARCSTLPALLKQFDPSGAERLLLFLGTIHNYWPAEILRSVLYPLRSQDQLLVGANLAPAANYQSALEEILRQYDNALTREWIGGALGELSITADDGSLVFKVAPAEKLPALQRIEANFVFSRAKTIRLFNETVEFEAGSKLRTFQSYRFTPEQLEKLLNESGLAVIDRWTTPQEGLFLCRRAA